ncbi:MAG: hypothetical protein LBC02_13915 [Planctomycetaceae bacterium]|nr:hypothetical protein [Planctomycetaceae bacterium]
MSFPNTNLITSLKKAKNKGNYSVAWQAVTALRSRLPLRKLEINNC